MFKPQPACKLILDRSKNAQVTKLCWTKVSFIAILCVSLQHTQFLLQAREHKYIAAGYSNGMVAVFDLSYTGTLLLSTDENGVQELMPFRIVHAHNHAVTG